MATSKPNENPVSSPISTLNTFNNFLFHGYTMPVTQRRYMAEYLLQWLDPLSSPIAPGWRLYSGEVIRTQIGSKYLIMLEVARTVMINDFANPFVRERLQVTDAFLLHTCIALEGCIIGECAHATVGLMRYLSVGGLRESHLTLDQFLKPMAQCRDGKGRWFDFPFYYSLLALMDIRLPAAREEMEYARPACERMLRRLKDDGGVEKRRLAIITRLLDLT